jgi:hypothetical protein
MEGRGEKNKYINEEEKKRKEESALWFCIRHSGQLKRHFYFIRSEIMQET